MTAQAERPEAVQEIERKYCGPVGLHVPSLVGLPGISGEPSLDVQKLSAQYYDTEDLRLARAGVTLRRRGGGDDEGWHLKIPVGEDVRTELRFPLSAGDIPPTELTGLVRGVTRDRPVALVALIATERRRYRLYDSAGTVMAEVVEDSVTAIVSGTSDDQAWNEIEVEQIAGSRKLLDAIESRLLDVGIGRSGSPSKLHHALHGAGALPTSPPAPRRQSRDSNEFVGRYLQQQIEQIVRTDIGVRRDEPESIHNLRKASRRARSALQAYAPDMGVAKEAQALILDLRWLGRQMSSARDTEVQWQRIAGRIGESPSMPQQEAVYARVNEHFSHEAETARKAAINTLASTRYVELLDSLDDFVAALATQTDPTRTDPVPTADLLDRLELLARKVTKRVNKVDAAASRPERDALIHRARKGAKRMRYAMEVIRSLAPKKSARALDGFDTFQDVLGEFQDSVVAQEHLLSMIEAPEHSAVTGFGLGIVYQLEVQVGDAQAALLDKAWRKALKPARALWR